MDNTGGVVPEVTLTMAYDFEGNRKTRTRLSDGQVTEYFWDHRNQLTKALIKDANGTLLKKAVLYLRCRRQAGWGLGGWRWRRAYFRIVY